MLIINTKLPNPDLFANRKNGKNWTATKDAKLIDKEAGFYDTKLALGGKSSHFLKTDILQIRLNTFYSDNKYRDWDNIAAACKAILDGVFLALGVDDKMAVIGTVDKRGRSATNPHLQIVIEKLES